MFCTKCGKENKDDSSFCAYCGASLDQKTRSNTAKYFGIILLVAIVVVGIALLVEHYRATSHETVTFDGAIIVGADGHHIALENNPKAKDVTWAELKQFLQNDQTNKVVYDYDTFVCADFAERLHNNAEKAGIRAAYVGIHLGSIEDPDLGCPRALFAVGANGHACNAFQTTDKGLVFVDDTGAEDGSGEDCTVSLVEGQTYTPESIFSDTEWCPMGYVVDFGVFW